MLYKYLNMKKHTFITISLVLLIFGCKAQEKEDVSLSVNEYEKYGMPTTRKIWISDDYDKTIVLLNEIKKGNFKSLPRANSEKSKPYFDRIISEENLSFIEDTTITLQKKAFLIQSFAVTYGKLIYLYYQENSKTQYYNEELINIYIFGLKLTDKLFDFANLNLKSTKEPNAQMKAGIENMSSGYYKTILTYLDLLVQNDVYQTKDLEKFSIELKINLNRNINWLNSERRGQIKEKLNQTKNLSGSKIVKDNQNAILKLL